MGSNLCPGCGADNFVTVSTYCDKHGDRHRKKRCHNCGASWDTIELTQAEALKMRKILKIIDEVMSNDSQ